MGGAPMGLLLDRRAAETVIRSLLQDGGDSNGDGGDAAGTDSEDNNRPETRNLRIVALLVILVAGLVGSIPPLIMKSFRSPGHPLPRIMRALSAGIILALACIHIIPEAVLEMDQLTDLMGTYPYNPAGACAVFGVLLMIILDAITHSFLDKRAKRAALTNDSNSDSQIPDALFAIKASSSNSKSIAGPVAEALMDNPQAGYVEPAGPPIRNTTIPQATARDQVVVYLFEFGCVFHSLVIGLTLGVTTEDAKQVRALLIALSFHQWLEGVALGSFITRAHLPQWKGMFMVILYSLTCPIGVGVGIGVADTYDGESNKAIAIQGVLNGVSGGMLLYIPLVQMIAMDFAKGEPAVHGNTEHRSSAGGAISAHGVGLCNGGPVVEAKGWVAVATHAALVLGAACMAVLAIWA